MEADGAASALIAVVVNAAFLGVLGFGWGVRRCARPLRFWVMAGAAALLVGLRLVAGGAPIWTVNMLAVLILVVFVVGIVLLFMGGVHLLAATGLRHMFRKTVRAGLPGETRGDGRASPELEALATPLVARGFTRLFVGQRDRHERILLLRNDGVIAEVASGPATTPTHPHIVVELTSTLVGRRGLLCSGTSGIRLAWWAGELRQVFPGNEPAALVEHHDAALLFLRGRSILADPVDPSDVLELEGWGHKMLASASAAAPTNELSEHARAFATRAHLDVGLLSADPNVDRRIAAFWDAVRAQ
jgi:hypothetical protein